MLSYILTTTFFPTGGIPSLTLRYSLGLPASVHTGCPGDHITFPVIALRQKIVMFRYLHDKETLQHGDTTTQPHPLVTGTDTWHCVFHLES